MMGIVTLEVVEEDENMLRDLVVYIARVMSGLNVLI